MLREIGVEGYNLVCHSHLTIDPKSRDGARRVLAGPGSEGGKLSSDLDWNDDRRRSLRVVATILPYKCTGLRDGASRV